MRMDLLEAAVEKYAIDDCFLENICFAIPDGMFRKIYREFDLILPTYKKILFFANVRNEAGEAEAAATLRAAFGCLAAKLSQGSKSFVVCGINDTHCFYWNKYSDRLHAFSLEDRELFCDLIDNEMLYGEDVYSFDELQGVVDIIRFSCQSKTGFGFGVETKISSSGAAYVKKHGTWREASDIEPEDIFPVAALGGMLGLHLFYQHKTMKGLTYLFTLGFFGAGWLLDCLLMLIGSYKDVEGRYVLPLEGKGKGLWLLLVGAVIFALLCVVVYYGFTFAHSLINQTIAAQG